MEVLRGSLPCQPPKGNRPVPIIDNDDTAGLWHNVDIEGSNLLLGHESQDLISNSQDMIFEDQVLFGVKGLQAEANAILNPEWTLRLEDFAVTQSTEPSIGTDHSLAGMLDPMLHGPRVDLIRQPSAVQQAGSGPEYDDIGGSMLTSLQNVTAPPQTQSNTIQQLETADDSVLLDFTKPLCSMPTPTPVEVPKRASKRKRIKSALSRKKPCLTTSYHTYNEDFTVLRHNLSSKLTLRTEAAEKITTNNPMSLKRPGHDFQTEHSRIDWMLAREQSSDGPSSVDNAGIVRDIRVLDSERRPMSWPHRNPWRKSLDISVAVLMKGFEKLVTERGEALSAV